jgi:arylformamidase
MHLDDKSATAASPLFWSAPARTSLDAVVGEYESKEYFRQSKTIVGVWSAAGVEARFGIIPNTNHFTAIAGLAEPRSAMTLRLLELASR